MSTPSRRLRPSKLSVSGTTEMDREDASASGRSAVESVTMAMLAIAWLISGRITAAAVVAVFEEAVFNRLDGNQRHQHDHRGEDGDRVIAESDRHAKRCDHPDRRGSRQPPDQLALTEYRSGAKKTDAGHDLSRNTSGVHAGPETLLEAERREHA